MAGHINTPIRQDWCTPEWIKRGVYHTFDGRPDLDPCSNPESIMDAKVELYDGGLEYDWGLHKNIFVNPPFNRNKVTKTSLYNWVEKCRDTRLDFKAILFYCVRPM